MKKTLTTLTLLAFLALPAGFVRAQEKTEAPVKVAATSDKAAEHAKMKKAKAECKKEGKKGKELKACIEEKLKQ